MAIASNFPAIRPSLNLDFANARALDPRITFSRASAATYYDGKTVAKAEENLLLRSQEFDQGPWAVAAAGAATAPVRTANYGVAPDGTSTADRAVFSLNGGITATDLAQVLQTISVTSGATYTFSVWAKATDGASSYSIQLAGPGAATSMTVTGAWTRFSVTGTAPGAAFDLQVRLRGGQAPVTSDAADILLWGAQLEQRSQVTAYTPTTTQPITNYIPVLQTAPAGVPRFDHNPVTGESLGLLVEEQRTNLLSYSEQFELSVWSKLATSVAQNATFAPDGTLTADKLVESTLADLHRVNYNSFGLVSGNTYTASFFAKAAERSSVKLTTYTGTSDVVSYVDLSDGTVLSGTALIRNVGNGWHRISQSFTATLTTNSPYAFQVYFRKGVADAYLGDGYSGIYIWGAQIEAGAFPTSYIKTEASQVTRAADSAQMTGANFSSWYRQDEGTMFADYLQGFSQLNQTLFSVANESGVNQISLYNDSQASSGISPSFFVSNGVTQTLIAFSALAESKNKLVGAYAYNDFCSALNVSVPASHLEIALLG